MDTFGALEASDAFDTLTLLCFGHQHRADSTVFLETNGQVRKEG